jgi:hypothetical protein
LIDIIMQIKHPPFSKSAIGCFIACLIALVVADGVRQSHAKAIQNPNDFVTLYAGSICITHSCDPYRIPEIDSVLVSRRGTAIRQDWPDQLPIYPPTTLFLLLPLSFLSYKTATVTWYLFSFAIYVSGLCWLCFVSPALKETPLLLRVATVLLGIHFPRMLQCLGFGNPSLIVTGLLLFSVFAEVDRRKWTRIIQFVALVLACLLKPPLALPVAVLSLFRARRENRNGWIMAAALAGFFLVGGLSASIFPGMTHWQRDLRQNLALGENGGMSPSFRGTASNSLLNFANIPGYFTTNVRTIELVTLAALAIFLALYGIALFRLRKHDLLDASEYSLAVATIAALTLLPVYHRFCDIGILLLVSPWLIREFSHRPQWRAWFSLCLLGLLYFSWERRIHFDHLSGVQFKLAAPLYFRGDALLVFLLACTLLSEMLSYKRLRPVETY